MVQVWDGKETIIYGKKQPRSNEELLKSIYENMAKDKIIVNECCTDIERYNPKVSNNIIFRHSMFDTITQIPLIKQRHSKIPELQNPTNSYFLWRYLKSLFIWNTQKQ